jgi:transcriptional regulator with XRE-family HTH domain
MLDKDNTLEYNYKILSQERKKQKISQEGAATFLTLSITQIKSLENNATSGFINLHFKTLALKRYAKFLEIDFNRITLPKDTEDITLNDLAKEPDQMGRQPKINLKLSKKITLIGLTILGLVLIFFFIQSNYFNDESNHVKLSLPKSNSSEEVYKNDPMKDSLPISKNFIQNNDTVPDLIIQEISNTSEISPIEFLCSIKSASIDKFWSRINPDKPANYFHIVSRKKQSICTLDNQGQFKQYNLDEGEKLTHRGEAPFKIQLNPSISELYFQGWKVILKEGDNFIQLNPVDMAIELN